MLDQLVTNQHLSNFRGLAKNRTRTVYPLSTQTSFKSYKMKRIIIAALTVLTFLISLSSCEEQGNIYEVQILNECYTDILNTGVPFIKTQIDEVLFNEKVVAIDIQAPIGEGSSHRVYSEYFNIESGIDYEITIKYTTYTYIVDELEWDEGTEGEYVVGTETWSDNEEHTKFALKFTHGDILNGFRPVFESFYVE